MDHVKLVPYAFKRFSVLSALRTGLPTLRHLAFPTVLPPSDRVALFTMNIFPPMLRVWHHFTMRSIGNDVDVVAFDCSGTLNPRDFPGMTVQKFINPRYAQKCDNFLHVISRNRSIAWICDDDTFITSHAALDIVKREMAVPNTAAVSFEPRKWWEFDINGKRTPPLGTYCLALNRAIVSEKEHLSFRPADGNTHPSLIRNGAVGRFDSFDKANETLLKNGYRCHIVDAEEAKACTINYEGLSAAVMLLAYFKTPEQTCAFFEGPAKEKWSGNMLFRCFQGMLSLVAIRKAAEILEGRPIPVRSLPTMETLARIRKDVEPHLRSDCHFRKVDENNARLAAAL